MRSRLRAAVAVTLVVGLVLAVVAAFVARTPGERDEIRAADRVALAYRSAMADHVRAASDRIRARHEADRDGYQRLLRTVQAEIDRAPRLSRRGTTAYGRAHSAAYGRAPAEGVAALGAMRNLAAYLRDAAIPESAFIAAGRKLVRIDPAELVGDTPITSGAPLRDLLLPPYEKARDRLKKQATPPGSDLLQLDLSTYARDVVSMIKKGADAIDDGKPYFLRLGDRPAKLDQRLATLEVVVQNDVDERVDVVDAEN